MDTLRDISGNKQTAEQDDSIIRKFIQYKLDWNLYAKEKLGVRLDRQQRIMLRGIQENRKIAISSGHARGKDYLAAVSALCFLYLNYSSRVICTAPTGRQVISIMMSTISKIHGKAKVKLGGRILTNNIFPIKGDKDWFLIGFKAGDKKPEDWSGLHSDFGNFIVVTEASGIPDVTFEAIEGLLTGNSKLLICFNPNRLDGVTYDCSFDDSYKHYSLSCLNAPNVRAKKILIPGQIDYQYIKERTGKPGWSREVNKQEFRKNDNRHFKFEGKLYIASDLYCRKILGQYPREKEDQLVPLSWIMLAEKRYEKILKSRKALKEYKKLNLALGVDVAGMGTNNTVFCDRRGMFAEKFSAYGEMEHMQTCGKIKNKLKTVNDYAYIDVIGEGAGVYSRGKELGLSVVRADFRYKAEKFHDFTGEREFINMRAFCYWAIRDNLDPEYDGMLALPYIPELRKDLMAQKWDTRSDGKIFIIKKDLIKEVLGRSPDWSDSLALSFFPYSGKKGRVSFK